MNFKINIFVGWHWIIACLPVKTMHHQSFRVTQLPMKKQFLWNYLRHNISIHVENIENTQNVRRPRYAKSLNVGAHSFVVLYKPYDIRFGLMRGPPKLLCWLWYLVYHKAYYHALSMPHRPHVVSGHNSSPISWHDKVLINRDFPLNLMNSTSGHTAHTRLSLHFYWNQRQIQTGMGKRLVNVNVFYKSFRKSVVNLLNWKHWNSTMPQNNYDPVNHCDMLNLNQVWDIRPSKSLP